MQQTQESKKHKPESHRKTRRQVEAKEFCAIRREEKSDMNAGDQDDLCNQLHEGMPNVKLRGAALLRRPA